MRLPIALLLASGTLVFSGCAKDEEPPPEPPVIVGAELVCVERPDVDYEVIDRVLVEVTDVDRDLDSSSIHGSINGILMNGFTDPDADEKYEWSPAGEFDPPMVCNGDFTIVIQAADIEGRTTRETLIVTK